MQQTLVNAAIELTLDGRSYTLRYRAFAFIQYRQRLKRDLILDLSNLIPKAERLSKMQLGEGGGLAEDSGLGDVFETLADILWVGLLDAHNDVSLADVQRSIGMADVQPICTAIMAAIVPSLPDRRGKAGAEAAGDTANPTGASSTSNGSSINGASSEPVAESSSQNSNG